MKVYGYKEKVARVINDQDFAECELLLMNEVSFSASAEELREIAKFINDAADWVENRKPINNGSHKHASFEIEDWDEEGCDIIIGPPEI